MIVAAQTLSAAEQAPKQCKLLGATVRGLGLVVAVSSTLTYGYAIVEGTDQVNHRVAFADLKRDEVVFPAAVQPFVTRVEPGQLRAVELYEALTALTLTSGRFRDLRQRHPIPLARG